MKHSKKNIVFPFLLGLMLWLGSGDLLAQKYRVAAGWRAGGGPNGISLKIVPVRGFAMEGIFGIYPLGESATLLLQQDHLGGNFQSPRPGAPHRQPARHLHARD